jgi:hypothetical protein
MTNLSHQSFIPKNSAKVSAPPPSLNRRQKMTKFAQTKSGKTVEIGKCRAVEGGWISYMLHKSGYAVLVFIPNG